MPMDRERPRLDRDLRELLTYLRDTFRDAASRIDEYIVRNDPPPRGREAPRDRGGWQNRDAPRDNWRDAPQHRDGPQFRDAPQHRNAPQHRDAPRDQGHWGGGDDDNGGRDQGPPSEIHEPLERLREEVRTISTDAPAMEPGLLRLHIEAITAETRQLQGRASDPVDQEIAARIIRALTAIVSEHRPGHVYGLARHHQTDWEEMARRARDEIRERGGESPDAATGGRED